MDLPLELTRLLAFCAAAGAVVVSPGPDTLLILRNTLSSGRRVGLATVLGVQLGLLVHTAAAIAGLSLLIASTPWMLQTLALLGALYLGWLGLQGLRDRQLPGSTSAGARVAAHRALRDALLTNVLNPKVILLFIALLPNFVEPRRGAIALQLTLLAGALIVINILWQAPIAWAADTAQRLLASARARAWVGRVSGLILLSFAALLVWDYLLAS